MSFFSRIKEAFTRPSRQENALPVPTISVPPELFVEIRNLRQQAEWMGNLLEDDMTGESGFTNGLDGTDYWGRSSQVGSSGGMSYGFAYSQCIFRPSYGAAFCINEAQHRIIRAKSRAFCSINPYWHGVQHNIRTHVVGKGHNWMVVPRIPKKEVPEQIQTKVQLDMDEFYQAGYRIFQKEKCDRKSRDGEAFIQFYEDDGRLRVRFIEPLLVWTPPGKSETNECLFGIQYIRGDYENPIGYHVRRTNYLGAEYGNSLKSWERMIPADEIQHIKVNVDRGTPRGIPDTYWIQGRLEQALRTMKASGLLVQIRSKVAMIRRRVNALAGAVQPMLSANAVSTISAPGGNPRTVMELPDASFFDVSDQADYQMPAANLEIKETVAAIHAELQSAASSMGLADYMVSGTLGQGSSYATSMVAEGPVVKTMEDFTSDMIDEDREVVNRIIDTGINHGRYPEETKELIKVEMAGPPLARISVQEAQTMQIESQVGVLSRKTWRQMRGYDNETENANIKEEQADDLKRQAEEAAVLNPQPTVSGNGNPQANGKQPRNKQGANARPFTPDQEPRQIQRESGATKEEFQLPIVSRFLESSHDFRTTDRPTKEDIAMAAKILTDEWKASTKQELLALSSFQNSPREDGVKEEIESGIQGVYLGMVDHQKVYAVDPDAIMLKYDCPNFVVAGNSEKWKGIVPDDLIYIDWSFDPPDVAHDGLHEGGEFRLMQAGWSYNRAHRYANWGPDMEMDFIKVLRPELASIAGTGVTEQTEKDQTT